MITATASVLINCPLPDVFNTAADPFKQLIWDTRNFRTVEQLTPGPIEKGSRYRAVLKGAGVMDYEFAEYEPFRRFVHRSKMMIFFGMHWFEFSEVNNHTQLAQTMEIRLRGLAILLYPFMKGILRKNLTIVNTELKNYLENSSNTKPAV